MTRSQQAKVAAHTSWANTADRAARTAAARSGLEEKFYREAREQHPGATEREIAQMAESARKAHYRKLSAAGVAARKGAA